MVALEVKIQAPAQQFVLLSRSIDLSAGGAYVRCSRALPVGTHVTVQFARGETHNPLGLAATVRRIGRTADGRIRGLGLEFQDVSALDAALVAELIATAGC